MKINIVIFSLLLLFVSTQSFAQSRKGKKTFKGEVTNFEENPIQGAQIFIDYVKTRSETDKKGKYKVDVRSNANLLSVYHPDYGVLSWKLTRKRKVDFVFLEESSPLSEQKLQELGFNLEIPEYKEEDRYSAYMSILEILDSEFNNVKVVDGRIYVGRGIHVFNANTDPLVLVDNVPRNISSLSNIPTTEVKSIRVVDKGSEAATYGLRGANGVIIIKLKRGSDD